MGLARARQDELMTAESKHFVTKDFPLICFSPKTPDEIQLQGSYTVEQKSVIFSFTWGGRLCPQIQGVGSNSKFKFDEKKRQDELWKKTCFELFFSAGPSNLGYQEVNLSPSGHWNVYSFTSERQGMQQSPDLMGVAFSEVSFTFDQESCQLQLDFSRIKKAEEFSFRVGMTAVLQIGAETTYWAMTHLKNKPDFHDRKSWTGVLYV